MGDYLKNEEDIRSRARGLFLHISNAILFLTLSKMDDQEMCDATLEKINDFLSEYNSHKDRYLLEDEELENFVKINQAANTQGQVEGSLINKIVWKMEELGIYLWLLESVVIPGYDTQFNSNIFQAVGRIEESSLIDKTLANKELERALLYLWRYHLEASNTLQELTIDTATIISKRLDEIRNIGLEVEIKDNDLVLFEQRYGELPANKKDIIRQICERRIHALEWVLDSNDTSF